MKTHLHKVILKNVVAQFDECIYFVAEEQVNMMGANLSLWGVPSLSFIAILNLEVDIVFHEEHWHLSLDLRHPRGP